MIGQASLILILLGAPASDASRTMRLIGNAGFELSDGTHTVFLDFPYVSGAFGYMKYEESELVPRPSALCLISHAHADHFNVEAIGRIGCQVAGPASVVERVADPLRLEGASPWRFGPLVATCIDSEHGGVEHCSLVLRWHGTTIVAVGDVESLEPLLEVIPRPDLVVLPYWLARQAALLQDAFPGVRVILSHEEPGASVDSCNACERLGQGDTVAW